jgi:oligogalacturonide lyase
MKTRLNILVFLTLLFIHSNLFSQIGKRFPSEMKVVKDPVTGTLLTFLTTTPNGDSKIYQTHNQWTSDKAWLIFRSKRVPDEAIAVHEKTGVMVQVTEGGYMGMLNIARNSMKLYFMRKHSAGDGSIQIIEVDLEKLFADSKSGKLKAADFYQRVCATTPVALGAGGDMAMDANEDWAYFRIGKEEAARHLAAGTKIEESFGPRKMGAGPSGIGKANIHTGEIQHVISVPFQVGHIQTNPWVPGEIVFCWETGGKSPQRTWTVMSDGSGLRPLYPESPYEWVTHEAVISKDEVAIAILGHRPIDNTPQVNDATKDFSSQPNPGQEKEWGPSGTREKPTGLGIVNLRTREMTIVGQTPTGSGLWHISGSSDGRWAVGDDFSRSIYLIDRHTREMILLSAGHKTTASDHPHPTFSPDGTKIQVQSAMLSEDNKTMNICVIPVPADWLKRRYK